MANRTRKGAGSVTKRKDGRWHGRFTRPDGTRGHVYGRTKDEASRKLAVAMRQAEDGTAPTDERVTVGTFLGMWLDAARPQVRPRTWEAYESMVRVHLRPSLGRLKLAKLRAAHIDAMLAKKTEDGLSAATVNKIRAVLRIALGQAVDWDLVNLNAAARAKPVKASRSVVEPLTANEARTFLAGTADDRLYPLWALALGTGMRQGECLGLQWSDVDLEAATAHVRHTLQPKRGSRHSNRDLPPTLYASRLAPPKSKRARRTVNLPAFVVTALRAHRAAQGREKLSSGGAWAEGDYVFTTPVGTPLDASNVTHRLQAALAYAGLPRQRFHDLRHAAASLLLAQGADLRTVMEVLGHSSITLTANTYSHVGRAAMRDAAAKLEAALGSVPLAH